MSTYSQRLPLEYLSLANQVILSLEHFRKGQDTPEDEKAMQEALEFIKIALRGGSMEEYRLDDETMRTSLISSGALRVYFSFSKKSLQKATVTEFQKLLIKYVYFINDLIKKEGGAEEFSDLAKAIGLDEATLKSQPREKTINDLKEFFRTLRDLILEETALPMEKVAFS